MAPHHVSTSVDDLSTSPALPKPAPPAPETNPEYIPTRSSLLSRLRNLDDHTSWSDFFETYWRLIYRTAVRFGLSDAEAQDVVQETVITISKNLPEFRYDSAKGSFKGWLLQTTRWKILNHVRKQARIEGCQDQLPENVPDPAAASIDAIWEAEWEQNLLNSALERVKRRVNPKHFQAFELYALREWPVRKVAETLLMSVPQVYLAKHRVAADLKEELKKLKSGPL